MYLIKIFSLVRGYNKVIFLNWIINILAAFFTIISVATIQPALGILFETQSKVTSPMEYKGMFHIMEYGEKNLLYLISKVTEEYGNHYSLLYVGIFIVLMFFLKNLFVFLSSYILAIIGNGIVYELRRILYEKILSLPVKFFSNRKKGDIISRITNDITEIQRTSLNSLQTFIMEPLVILGSLFALIVMSWKLTLFVLLLLPLSGSLIAIIGKKLKAHSKKVSEDQGRMFSNIEETINGLKIIRIFSAENKVKKYFDEITNSLRVNSTNLQKRQSLGSPMSEFLGSCVLIAVLIYGGNLVLIEKSIEPQSFIVYLALFFQMIQPIKKVASAFYEIQRGKGPYDRFMEILNEKIDIKEIENPIKIKSLEKGIEFKNVSFEYQEGIKVLDNISLRFERGKTTALIGASGGGKTTITNLITRFYDVSDGEILIDGYNIKNFELTSLRSLYGMVSQDNVLFNDTVCNNISLGVQKTTLEEVENSAKIANAHEFISNMENGYNENIGDGGGKLSGGQKQRVSIARAILKNPPILILDEATSALDAENEKMVQLAMENVLKGRTSIVIAHRLSTIKNADKIIFIENGKILEEGTHQELMKKENGNYKRLVELQNFK